MTVHTYAYQGNFSHPSADDAERDIDASSPWFAAAGGGDDRDEEGDDGDEDDDDDDDSHGNDPRDVTPVRIPNIHPITQLGTISPTIAYVLAPRPTYTCSGLDCR